MKVLGYDFVTHLAKIGGTSGQWDASAFQQDSGFRLSKIAYVGQCFSVFASNSDQLSAAVIGGSQCAVRLRLKCDAR
jgi:hypothetical protein